MLGYVGHLGWNFWALESKRKFRLYDVDEMLLRQITQLKCLKVCD